MKLIAISMAGVKGRPREYRVGARSIQPLDQHHLLPHPDVTVIIEIISSILIYIDKYILISMHETFIMIMCRNIVLQHLFLISRTQNTILF